MQTDIFIQFALVLGVATSCGIVLYFLKQPLVAAYIITGVAISFFQLNAGNAHGILEQLPSIGIAFLLFLIGIELDIRELRLVGKPIILASLTQMALTTTLVAVLVSFLGFATLEAVFIGLALSFSSTIVIIKLLVDKQEITTLHGRIAIGILLIEDLVAILALMVLSLTASLATQGIANFSPFFILGAKTIAFVAIILFLSKVFINKLFSLIAKSPELLFFSAISWCFIFIALANILGFSLEIGAFLGGLSLASSPYRFQIAGRLKPLRDFFIALFFINLGMGIVFSKVVQELPIILLFSAIAIFIKPLLFICILSLLRFRRFTTYHTATSLSQISEFSVILFAAASQYGLVSANMVSVMAATTVLTVLVSSIFVNQNDHFYPVLSKLLIALERKGTKHASVKSKAELNHHTVIIGAHNAGEPLLEFLKEKIGDKLLVVDYNPELIKKLEHEGYRVVFGDIADPDVVEKLNVKEADMIISTIRQLKDNLLLLELVHRATTDAIIIVAANDEEEAGSLYKAGAHEVVIPLLLEGQRIVRLLSEHWDDLAFYRRNRENHLED